MSKHLNISDKHWTICNAHVGENRCFQCTRSVAATSKNSTVYFYYYYFGKLGTSTC